MTDQITKEDILETIKLKNWVILVNLTVITAVLWIIWSQFRVVDNPWLVIFPRNFKSLTAIFTTHFLHFNTGHL